MGFSHYNPNERYRQRFVQRIAGLIVVFGVAGASLLFGFWLGQGSAGQRTRTLNQEVKLLKAERERWQEDVTTLRAEAQLSAARFEQLQENYEQTIPEGPMEELLDLVRTQLEEGMKPERMAFLIRSARAPRNCTDPETKRFVVSTPAYEGAESVVQIAGDGLQIKGAGYSARNETGAPEAWYDPSRSVTVAFIYPGGKMETKKGVLPLHHSVVLEDREYRFTVDEGARSFAKVTFDSCDYP